MGNILETVVAILLLALAGGLVFYNLIPLAFTDASLRRDIQRLKIYLAMRWHIMTRYTMELGGYVHDTSMSQFIPPHMLGVTAGTWVSALASNVQSYDRTAADANFTVIVPCLIPSNSNALKGGMLKSIELMYSVGTAAMDDIASVKLYKDTLQASAASGSGTLNTAAEVTAVTIDAGHDTAAERKAQDEHRMVVTLTTPVFIDNDEAYHLEVVCDAAATSVFKLFGAIINYTLRV